jgi:hypothetical protein
MIRSSALPARVLAAAFAVAALAGCVKKQPTEVSPTYTPEGTFSTRARLIVYPDAPSILLNILDRPPVGSIGTEDTLLSTTELRRASAGTFHMMLFDGTQANAFELLRRETGGGYFSVNDFLLNPTRKWIDGQREVYVTSDPRPGSFSPATYMLRGLIGGAITSDSPLSNAAIVNTAPILPITLTSSTEPVDSLFNISWVPVPGAAGYWVHVYQFLEAQRSDQVLSGVPAPAYVERVRDYFLGFVPAPNNSYKLGSTPADVDIFTRRTTLRGQSYLTRVSAVDASGALIAYTYGDFGVIPGEGFNVTMFPLGARRDNEGAASGSQAAARPAGGREDPGIDHWMGDLPIVRAP